MVLLVRLDSRYRSCQVLTGTTGITYYYDFFQTGGIVFQYNLHVFGCSYLLRHHADVGNHDLLSFLELQRKVSVKVGDGSVLGSTLLHYGSTDDGLIV